MITSGYTCLGIGNARQRRVGQDVDLDHLLKRELFRFRVGLFLAHHKARFGALCSVARVSPAGDPAGPKSPAFGIGEPGVLECSGAFAFLGVSRGTCVFELFDLFFEVFQLLLQLLVGGA